MDGDPPPGFTKVTSKGKASRKARTATKTSEGPGSRGKADPRSLSGPSGPKSAPKTSTSGNTGPSGVAESLETVADRQGQTADPGKGPAGLQAGAAVPVATPVASGSAGPVAAPSAEKSSGSGASGAAASSAAASGSAMVGSGLSGCWKCGKEGHYRSNCPEQKTKRKRSGATGTTPGGKQAKTGGTVDKSGSSAVTKHQKQVFNWSAATLVVLEKDGQPLTLDKYNEVVSNFVLKEIDLTEKDGTLIDIDQWKFHQDRVEVKFANVASTEIFRRLMPDHKVISREKWEEEHVKLHHFTGKVDSNTIELAKFERLRWMVDTRRKSMGIPGYFRLEKVICSTPTGAIVLVSCDDEARAKWLEVTGEEAFTITIPGSGKVTFQERSKGKKTLKEVSLSLESLSVKTETEAEESPVAQGASAQGKDK